jgi:hypothetical protein
LIDSPNWVHVANFRHASRELLGARTRAWIDTANPPVPLNPAGAPTLDGVQQATDTRPVAAATQAS